MAISTNFLPTVWSARLHQQLEERFVYAQLFNRNWERDAQGGNKVRIGTITTDITVRDYSRNTDINAPEVLTDSQQDLNLDQQKYFNVYVDDIDRFQVNPDLMSEAMRKSAIAISKTVDGHCSGVLKAARAADSANDSTRLQTKTTALSANTDAFVPELRELILQMKKADIDNATRKWMVVPPEFTDTVTKFFSERASNGLFTPATTEETLRNGFSGRLIGFDLYESNSVPQVTVSSSTYFQCFAGTMDAATYADQINNIENYRPEARFGDAVKGLYVYGSKVIDLSQLYELRIATS